MSSELDASFSYPFLPIHFLAIQNFSLVSLCFIFLSFHFLHTLTSLPFTWGLPHIFPIALGIPKPWLLYPQDHQSVFRPASPEGILGSVWAKWSMWSFFTFFTIWSLSLILILSEIWRGDDLQMPQWSFFCVFYPLFNFTGFQLWIRDS